MINEKCALCYTKLSPKTEVKLQKTNGGTPEKAPIYVCSEECLRSFVLDRIKTSTSFQHVNFDRWTNKDVVRFFRNNKLVCVVFPLSGKERTFMWETNPKLVKQLWG
jgi:hypothetical protein